MDPTKGCSCWYRRAKYPHEGSLWSRNTITYIRKRDPSGLPASSTSASPGRELHPRRDRSAVGGSRPHNPVLRGARRATRPGVSQPPHALRRRLSRASPGGGRPPPPEAAAPCDPAQAGRRHPGGAARPRGLCRPRTGRGAEPESLRAHRPTRPVLRPRPSSGQACSPAADGVRGSLSGRRAPHRALGAHGALPWREAPGARRSRRRSVARRPRDRRALRRPSCPSGGVTCRERGSSALPHEELEYRPPRRASVGTSEGPAARVLVPAGGARPASIYAARR